MSLVFGGCNGQHAAAAAAAAADAAADAGSDLVDAGPRVTDGGNGPSMYTGEFTYTALKLGTMNLLPAHRQGPTVVADMSVLPITVWAPEGVDGPLPLVIWSHGGGSRRTPGESGLNWSRSFAAAGFAVVAMHHMARPRADVTANICGPLGIATASCDLALYTSYYESTDRPQDAVAVLDSLSSIGASFAIDLDPTRVVVAGHSGGAATPIYLAGGVRNALPPGAPREAWFGLVDTRPLAFIAMSPAGAETAGWRASSLLTIDRPVLTATGAGDIAPAQRVQLHDALGEGDKFRLYLNSSEAGHDTFGLSGGLTGLQPVFVEFLSSAARAFVDAFANQRAEARSWLLSDQLERLIDDVVEADDALASWDAR